MPYSFTLTVERPELWLATFDNPPVNKVDPYTILKLQALVGQLEADPDVKVVVFDSAVPEHFLGPYDMTRAADTPSEPGPTGLPPWLDLTVRLARLPVVSIAVIRGVALGCGNEFALACDLRFASFERASIQQIGVHVGYGPGGGAVPRLPALIGRARTLEVILGSQPFDERDGGTVRTRKPCASRFRARRVRRRARLRHRPGRPVRADAHEDPRRSGDAPLRRRSGRGLRGLLLVGRTAARLTV